MKNRGKLIPIGGGEDRRNDMTVLKTFVDNLESRKSRIEVITVATNYPRDVADDYRRAFEDLEVENFDFIHFADPRDADERDLLDRIKKADGVFFSGGNQMKLIDALCNTKFLDLLKKRNREDKLVIAGTSAGAAALSTFMVSGGASEDALLKGEVRLTNGLGFIDGVIIDTHFTERGRYSRLMSIVGTNPSLLGLGFGEDTAAVINGSHIEVIGSGLVVIIDGSGIKYSTVTTAKEGEPLTIESLTVHLLATGEKFDLHKKQIVRKESKPRRAKATTKKRERIISKKTNGTQRRKKQH